MSDRLLMVTIPKRQVAADWDGQHAFPPDCFEEARYFLRQAAGVLPPGLQVEEYDYDLPTQCLRVVVSHPRFREFRDGDVLAAARVGTINAHGWESVMEKA